MYSSKLVASLKANGKILREFKDTVYIPFGSEYSILLKNLNNTRAVINVFIDGEDQCPGGLVLNAGQEIDFERSVKNNNLREGNKFKFIERSGAVEEHRGVKLEDGLIRIEFQFERYVHQVFPTNGWVEKSTWPKYPDGGITRRVDMLKGQSMSQLASGSIAQYSANNNITNSCAESNMISIMDCNFQSSLNEVGITVPGSKSTQQFSTVTVGTLEPEKHSIVLKILGETPDNKPVTAPVTTKAKPKCVTCGKLNNATSKFCTQCGTALEIF